jgi:HAE1 family hydrophobic/amphiphilic exporter-1
VLRLKEVADVELGTLSYTMIGEAKGHPAVGCMVSQAAGSNATEISKQVDKLLDEISTDLPQGVKIEKILDINEFLDASIKNVLKTLLEAILLVIIVVYVFLQSLRSTLIPMVGIVVSLVGTFAFLAIAGFSINLLTLFALVLAIGTVVDNAIIMVEAVQAKLDAGYRSPYKATIDGMNGITPAIITSTLVFMAVFIPVSFMGGTSGKFFKQFGITMAVAVGLSAVNALTLSPALCALLIKPHSETSGRKTFEQRFRTAFKPVHISIRPLR